LIFDVTQQLSIISKEKGLAKLQALVIFLFLVKQTLAL